MKRHFVLLAFLIGISSYSQDEISRIINEINKNLIEYGADPSLTEVFLNRQQKILDIEGYQIPLELTNEIYKPDARIHEGIKIVGTVFFECDYNCIQNTSDNKKNSGVGFSFKSKKGAYIFINLIFRLKKELKYD